MIEKEFETRKTTRVYYNREGFDGVEYVWFGLHGYGQLAKYFARNFEVLDSKKHLVVVPEAQSRFYLEGVYGRVGASWMTKEDRLTDIKDYIHYLDELYQYTIKSVSKKKVKVVVFGFSQGAATACRWVNSGSVEAHHLVLWSGIFPPDLKAQGTLTKGAAKVWQLIGERDEYMSDDRKAENDGILREMNIEPNLISFDGGHKIYAAPLLDLVSRIEDL